MQNRLEKFGSFGAIIAAAACPICFPKLALIGAFFGLGALAKFETVFFFGTQILVVLALLGHAVSYKKHKNRKLLALVLISVIMFFIFLYVLATEIGAYAALAGLVAATVWSILEQRRCSKCVTSTE